MTVIHEYTGERLALRTERNIQASDVIETLDGLITGKGVSNTYDPTSTEFNGGDRLGIAREGGAEMPYIQPASPSKNG